MSHLNASEIVDLLEGALPEARLAHAVECPRCREEADRARAGLDAARRSDAAEPSPLFWDHFSARVREAIAEQPAVRGRGRWIWVPLAGVTVAMAVVIGAIVARAPLPSAPPGVSPGATAVGPAAVPDQETDEQWALVTDVADGVDWEEAADAGLAVPPGAAEHAVLQLSDEQQQELARLLQAEIGRLKS
ncbi:MAG TPA: hypothetical protein VK886_09125 [Vicinamibacterales bacterium]|nr:hypothetical protein [Vicinamibacterales bacterium]